MLMAVSHDTQRVGHRRCCDARRSGLSAETSAVGTADSHHKHMLADAGTRGSAQKRVVSATDRPGNSQPAASEECPAKAFDPRHDRAPRQTRVEPHGVWFDGQPLPGRQQDRFDITATSAGFARLTLGLKSLRAGYRPADCAHHRGPDAVRADR